MILLFTILIIDLLLIGIIVSNKPISAMLCLLIIYTITAGSFIKLKLTYLGVAFIIIYIGAICIVFLYIIILVHYRKMSVLGIVEQYKNLAYRIMTLIGISAIVLLCANELNEIVAEEAKELGVYITTNELELVGKYFYEINYKATIVIMFILLLGILCTIKMSIKKTALYSQDYSKRFYNKGRNYSTNSKPKCKTSLSSTVGYFLGVVNVYYSRLFPNMLIKKLFKNIKNMFNTIKKEMVAFVQYATLLAKHKIIRKKSLKRTFASVLKMKAFGESRYYCNQPAKDHKRKSFMNKLKSFCYKIIKFVIHFLMAYLILGAITYVLQIKFGVFLGVLPMMVDCVNESEISAETSSSNSTETSTDKQADSSSSSSWTFTGMLSGISAFVSNFIWGTKKPDQNENNQADQPKQSEKADDKKENNQADENNNQPKKAWYERFTGWLFSSNPSTNTEQVNPAPGYLEKLGLSKPKVSVEGKNIVISFKVSSDVIDKLSIYFSINKAGFNVQFTEYSIQKLIDFVRKNVRIGPPVPPGPVSIIIYSETETGEKHVEFIIDHYPDFPLPGEKPVPPAGPSKVLEQVKDFFKALYNNIDFRIGPPVPPRPPKITVYPKTGPNVEVNFDRGNTAPVNPKPENTAPAPVKGNTALPELGKIPGLSDDDRAKIKDMVIRANAAALEKISLDLGLPVVVKFARGNTAPVNPEQENTAPVNPEPVNPKPENTAPGNTNIDSNKREKQAMHSVLENKTVRDLLYSCVPDIMGAFNLLRAVYYRKFSPNKNARTNIQTSWKEYFKFSLNKIFWKKGSEQSGTKFQLLFKLW